MNRTYKTLKDPWLSSSPPDIRDFIVKFHEELGLLEDDATIDSYQPSLYSLEHTPLQEVGASDSAMDGGIPWYSQAVIHAWSDPVETATMDLSEDEMQEDEKEDGDDEGHGEI